MFFCRFTQVAFWTNPLNHCSHLQIFIFTSLPSELVVESRVFDPHRNNYTYAQIADTEAVREYVQQFMDGTWPTQPDEPSCPDD